MGSNLGDKAARISSSLEALDRLPETRLVRASRFYQTEPVGKTDQDWFVNAAALIETGLSPRALLEALLSIENRAGRVRTEKWGPRLIDLDLLFYDDLIIEEEGLVVPHPYMPERRFVLAPLSEVAPDWVHPVLGLTPAEMLARAPVQGQEAAVL